MKFQHFQSFKPQSFRGESSSASLGFNQRGNFTVYVDNLPNSVGAPWFRKFFSNFGRIGDFHIPNKRSRRTGNRFGFIRFNNRREVDVAIARANGLWIGKRNLIVERASYDRGFEKPYFEVYSGALRNNYVGNQELDPSSGDPGKFSMQVEKNITINVQPVATEWLTRSVVAKLKEITTSEMVQNAFTELKFNKVLVRHMGGLDLIITFNSKEDRMLALNNPSVKSWFNSIKPWNGEAAGTSRLVWLKCRGMPLNVWSYQTFKRVGEIWGNFITLDVETLKEETFDVGRMLVTTDNSQNIDEWINIIVRGKNYKVKVWEEVCDDFFNEKSVRDWVKSHHPGIGNQFKPAGQTHHEEIGRVDLNQEVKDKAKSVVDLEKSHSKSFEEVQQYVDDITDKGDGYGAKVVGLVKDAEVAAHSGDIPNLCYGSVVKNHASGALFEEVSKIKQVSKTAEFALETISEEDEESMVGETPNTMCNSPKDGMPMVDKSKDQEKKNEVVGSSKYGSETFLEEPKNPSAREKRAKIRKNIRDIIGSIEEGDPIDGVLETSSDHSDSINTEDILRRNAIIMKGFEEAVNISKRLGVVHHESDEMVIKRMAQKKGVVLNKRILPASMS